VYFFETFVKTTFSSLQCVGQYQNKHTFIFLKMGKVYFLPILFCAQISEISVSFVTVLGICCCC